MRGVENIAHACKCTVVSCRSRVAPIQGLGDAHESQLNDVVREKEEECMRRRRHMRNLINNALNAWHRVDTFRFDVPSCSSCVSLFVAPAACRCRREVQRLR